jgi:hypothetical protein
MRKMMLERSNDSEEIIYVEIVIEFFLFFESLWTALRRNSFVVKYR